MSIIKVQLVERNPSMASPNILFIITDQQRADHVGFAGNQVVQTPHLDAIAASSTQFDNAYVANSICTPNRCSIITGRMPSAHGAASNGISLDWHANTAVRRLKDAGYATGLVGKGHFQDWGDLPPPFDNEHIPDLPLRTYRQPLPEDWHLYESRKTHRQRYVEFPDDYYGFSHVDMVVGHSDCCLGHYEHWLRARGFDPAELLGTMRPDSPAKAVYENWWQVRQPRLPEELYPSRYIADRSIAFLKQQNREQPFFLQVSFPDPHHPFTPPGKYWEMYDPAAMPLPPTYDDDHEHSTWLARAYARRSGNLDGVVQPFGPDEDQLRHALAAQYGMISLIDDCVGDIQTALTELGLADNTIIVFTSDHGDMFGDHHIILKGTMHYAGCVRVPLVINHPSIEPSRQDALVSSVDIAQTLLDLAGVEAYAGMHGASLAPIMQDSGASVRDALLIEDDYPADILRAGQPTRMRTIMTRQGRLTRYLGADMGELYDFEADPDERRNRFGERTALEDELTGQLIDEMTRVSWP
ncbi:MAG: sulfatase-like hydrolase/transferase [Gammaproteobacteria bacterium]|nr:sulfatase-like hydrolase/transferase [Gammaproteobacteria bacterium]